MGLRDPRTTRASPKGEANIHPTVLVLPGRDAGQTRPEQVPTTVYGAAGAGRAGPGAADAPRAARPQAPRGRGRSPRQRRTAVHGGWQNPRGWGDSAPQRKATEESLI